MDWEQIAKQLGSLGENSESGGTEYAIKALDIILGKEFIEHTVNWCIASKKGSAVAGSVLRHIESNTALNYCYPGFNVKVQHLDGKLPKELVCAHEKRVSAFGSRGT